MKKQTKQLSFFVVVELEKNIASFNRKIDPSVFQELNKATEDLKNAMGNNCDLWQGGEDTRIF